jgi:STAS domain
MTKDNVAGTCLTLEGALTMRTAETVRATLRDAIVPMAAAQCGNLSIPPLSIAPLAIAPLAIAPLAINCSAATEIDLTFVQLLVATRVSAGRLGGTVSLVSAPDGALLDTLTRGGFRVVRDVDQGDVNGRGVEEGDAAGDDISGAGDGAAPKVASFWFEGANA